jgi:hypothetical protein
MSGEEEQELKREQHFLFLLKSEWESFGMLATCPLSFDLGGGFESRKKKSIHCKWCLPGRFNFQPLPT